MKLLIDECLSPELTKLAHAAGYGESSHVVWMGLAARKDWELKNVILDGDGYLSPRTLSTSAGRHPGLAQRGNMPMSPSMPV